MKRTSTTVHQTLVRMKRKVWMELPAISASVLRVITGRIASRISMNAYMQTVRITLPVLTRSTAFIAFARKDSLENLVR